jgi:transcriptional regulator with PAS, ATPase and Fis domain
MAGRTDTKKKVEHFQGLVGKSGIMQDVYRTIAKAAETTTTVLIVGESGTGKELVARGIHYSSKQASAPFVPVNCGGIPEGLLESELFGFVKGAFTGAIESRSGFFQTADGGTIFLDEISETSLAMQVKLLRVFEDKEVCMVGSRSARKVDVRILAATNKNLLSLVKKNLFREDLYYRLNVITLEIPPLRERKEDILILTQYFAKKFAKEFDKRTLSFSDNALQVLKDYSWPGNVRELQNLIQRLVVMAEGDIINVPDLPSHMRFSVIHGTGLNRTLAEVEAEYIQNVLSSANGNKTKTAEILGIDRKTLREKLRKKEKSHS